MSNNLDYNELYKVESAGVYGAFGLKILVAVHPPVEEGQPAPVVDLDHETIRYAMGDVAKAIQKAVMVVQIAKMPQAQARAKSERENLLGVFPQPIFVEEIPNGYCPDYCCVHLPWFIVTTTVGRIKIGWRKSVINLDWSETKGTKTSAELFANENVTKDKRAIHAWDYQRAKAYVGAILTGSPLT
jgi:hypothetical protein